MLILRLIRVVSVIVAIVALFSMVFFVNKLPEMKGLGILLKLVVDMDVWRKFLKKLIRDVIM